MVNNPRATAKLAIQELNGLVRDALGMPHFGLRVTIRANMLLMLMSSHIVSVLHFNLRLLCPIYGWHTKTRA